MSGEIAPKILNNLQEKVNGSLSNASDQKTVTNKSLSSAVNISDKNNEEANTYSVLDQFLSKLSHNKGILI